MASFIYVFFFFNDTATTEIYTLSLHDALPICACAWWPKEWRPKSRPARCGPGTRTCCSRRSEEHTSELQSPCNLVCRLLLEKKKKTCCTPSTTLGALVVRSAINSSIVIRLYTT